MASIPPASLAIKLNYPAVMPSAPAITPAMPAFRLSARPGLSAVCFVVVLKGSRPDIY